MSCVHPANQKLRKAIWRRVESYLTKGKAGKSR